MSNLINQIIQNSYTRFLVFVFGGLVAMGVFFVYSTYNAKLEDYKHAEKEKLTAVGTTLSTEIKGDHLAYVLKKYPKEGQIYSSYQHPFYYFHNKLMKKIMHIDKIDMPIYTLVKDSNNFYYGFTSNEFSSYRRKYVNPPEEFNWFYGKGGFIEPHDNHGTTVVSYVAPIYDGYGNVASILIVESNFERFIAAAKAEALKEIWITVVVFIILLFFLYRTIKKFFDKENIIKKQIQEAHLELREKNHKILDSINYAKKIQNAILPTDNQLKKQLPNSFVFYEPRDIVSGDFYWLNTMSNDGNKIIIAAADCTGHGVPGALMSMLGNSALNMVVKQKGITKPSDILFEIRKEIIRVLNESDDGNSTNDGMDIALVSIDKSTNTIEYAGAFNPLYIVRDNEVIQYKATRQPIGSYWKKNDKPFENNLVQYQENDVVYIFSDGYADQFGGLDGKKLGGKKFRQILTDIASKPMDEQRQILDDKLREWRGSNEQLDDVLVIGFKVN